MIKPPKIREVRAIIPRTEFEKSEIPTVAIVKIGEGSVVIVEIFFAVTVSMCPLRCNSDNIRAPVG